MTNLQLFLTIFVPTFAVILVGLSNWFSIKSLETSMNARLIVIEGDLRQFYKDLGRHEGKIEMLEHRK